MVYLLVDGEFTYINKKWSATMRKDVRRIDPVTTQNYGPSPVESWLTSHTTMAPIVLIVGLSIMYLIGCWLKC